MFFNLMFMKYLIKLEDRMNGHETLIECPANMLLEELCVKIKVELHLPYTDDGAHCFRARGYYYVPDDIDDRALEELVGEALGEAGEVRAIGDDEARGAALHQREERALVEPVDDVFKGRELVAARKVLEDKGDEEEDGRQPAEAEFLLQSVSVGSFSSGRMKCTSRFPARQRAISTVILELPPIVPGGLSPSARMMSRFFICEFVYRCRSLGSRGRRTGLQARI